MARYGAGIYVAAAHPLLLRGISDRCSCSLALAFRGLGGMCHALQLRPRMRPVHDDSADAAADNHAAAGVHGLRSAVRAMGRTRPCPLSRGRGPALYLSTAHGPNPELFNSHRP